MSAPAFDPFTATFEEAEAQPDAYRRGGAVSRWAGAQKLLSGREFFERSPLDGMAVCASFGLVAPDWLAKAYLGGYSSVRNYRVRSWDAAFGAPVPKGGQLAALRTRMAARVRVARVVRDFVQRYPGESVDELYIAASLTGKDRDPGHVGEYARKLGVGKSAAQKLYAEAVALHITVPVDALRKALGAPARAAPTKLSKLAGSRRKR